MTTKTITRKSKGTVAAIAGAALLLATGGTFAYWQSQATLPDNIVTTGTLGLTTTSIAWEWTNETTNDELQEWTAVDAEYLMVPGHTVRGTFTVEAIVEGTELLADLTIGAVDGVASGIPGSVVTWSLDGSAQAWPQEAAQSDEGPWTISANLDDTESHEIQVTIELPFGNEVDNSANQFYNESGEPIQWSLEDAQVLLTQVNPNGS